MSSRQRNKIWIFGDSFSHGSGMNDWDDYFQRYLNPNNITKKEWGVYVAEHFDMELQNKSFGGLSNPAILRLVIENICNFNKGDIVLIGTTDEFRFEEIIDGRNQSYLVGDVMNNMSKDKKIQSVLEDYIRYIHMDNYKQKNKNIIKQIESIKDHLNNNDIKTIVWHYNTTNPIGIRINMDNVERITQHTNKDIIDEHPSYKGHEQVSKEFIKILTN